MIAKTILVTGCAGFIGYHTIIKLLQNFNYKIYGIDDLNNYYSEKLKIERIKNIKSLNKDFIFIHSNIININHYSDVLNKIDIIVHLAAQAGVEYSFHNPDIYMKSNIEGFFQILEFARKNNIKKVIYASSSSVQYNNPQKSLYAMTKKMNEIMAEHYTFLHDIKTIGIRFSSIFGEWGRPDLVFWKWADGIKNKKPIILYNAGESTRSFTYINTAVNSIIQSIEDQKYKDLIIDSRDLTKIKMINVLNFIEKYYNQKAIIENRPLQKYDIEKTNSGISEQQSFYIYLKNFLKWFDQYANSF
jgi:UDP-glucuronate 4-epimerase